MPLYEYNCTECKRNFVLLRKSSRDLEGIACPHCGGSEVEKVISTFSVGRNQPSASQPSPGGGDQDGPPAPPGPEFRQFSVTNNPELLK